MRNIPDSTIDRLREELISDPILELWRIQFTQTSGDEFVLPIVGHDEPVRFENQVYYPYAVNREAYQEDSAGSLPAVKLAISNRSRLLGSYIDDRNGMVEGRVDVAAVFRSQLEVSGAAIKIRFVVASASVTTEAVALILESYFRRQVQIPQRTLQPARCIHAFGGKLCGYNRLAVGAQFQFCNRAPQDCDLRGQDEALRGIPNRHPERGGFFPGLRRVR